MRNYTVVVLLAISLATGPVHASGIPVVDVANLSVNIKKKYIQLRGFMIKVRNVMNQIRQIQNEYQMIRNQAKTLQYQKRNLKKLNYSSFESLVDSYFELDALIQNTGSVYHRTVEMEKRLLKLWPDYDLNDIEGRAEVLKGLASNREKIGDALGTIEALDNTKKIHGKNMESLLRQSRKAEGTLQAQQVQTLLVAEMISHINEMKTVSKKMLEQMAMNNSRQEIEKIKRKRADQAFHKDSRTTKARKITELPMLH